MYIRLSLTEQTTYFHDVSVCHYEVQLPVLSDVSSVETLGNDAVSLLERPTEQNLGWGLAVTVLKKENYRVILLI